MIGVVLAGGSGSRLFPVTRVLSKQLLSIYDKPMIYYPLTTLMFAGIKDFIIIVDPSQRNNYVNLLGSGDQWGVNFTFVNQVNPKGIADCFNLVPVEFRNDSCAVILGDNLFYGMGLGSSLKSVFKKQGALAFAYEVSNPSEYGVVQLDENQKPINIMEKPSAEVGNLAIPGLYFFDQSCYEVIKQIKPSHRGELEITEVLQAYMLESRLEIYKLARGTAWLDTGTHANLLAASNFVQVIEDRQGLKIGCPEEVAYRQGFITSEQLLDLTNKMPEGSYRSYLQRIVS